MKLLPLVPAPGAHKNRRCEAILGALLGMAIFVGTRIAGTQGHMCGPSASGFPLMRE
jgi:hypothetical protein